MKKYCVYKHTCPNGKVYVGITCRKPEIRWNHGAGYSTQLFGRAVEKYGWDNIRHEILIEGLSKEEACAEEQRMIAEYGSTDPGRGYNLTSGGEHYNPTKEWREKLSGSLRDYYRAHPEAGAKISESQIGRKASDATRRKMSESRRAYLEQHPEERKRCGDSFRNKKRTRENIEKIREANSKPVKCVETGEIFASTKDAAARLGITRTAVTNQLRGRSKTCGGRTFIYEGGDPDEQNE